MDDYESILERFAKLGSEIINTDPHKHYTTIGRNAKRPMEPGFIPIEEPARLMTVSYYPNETELATPEFAASRRSFEMWGKSGTVREYKTAYEDWVKVLPQVPFYRDFNAPVFRELGIGRRDFGWLPLIKCPLPARTQVPEDDVYRDRMLLWDQLSMLRPTVILVQGQKAHEVVAPMCEGKFPHRIVLQRIGRVGTNEYHAAEDERVVRQLRIALTNLR
jgi:hypothetical protein